MLQNKNVAAGEHRDYKVYILFSLMVIIQLAGIIYCFQVKKEGWHSDEIWSYGYANSYYQKDIYIDNEGNPINSYEWVSGDVLRDYIEVNDGEQFQYDSIYQNQIKDLSPPLHSMILHTICSFFPETFSFWYSFVINIAAFLICMIYLFKTTTMLKGDWFALCCCMVYGFSVAARDTYIYLRMYAMCTALVMMILYHLLVYMKAAQNGTIWNRNLLAICILAGIGFLTHYYMIAFMGILTFCVCVYYLFSRKWKNMLVVGCSQLVMLLVSIGIFPALVTVSQSHNAQIAEDTAKTMNYNFELRFRILLHFITMKLFNIPISLFRSGNLGRILVCLVVVLIWLLPLFYLLRETVFVKWLLRRVRFLGKNGRSIIRWLLRRVNPYYIILTICVAGQIIAVGQTSNVYTMGDYEDRYLMYLYPVATIVGIAFLYQIGLIVFRKRRYVKRIVIAASVLLVVLNIRNRLRFQEYYFKTYEEGQPIEAAIEDLDCIYVEQSNWFLTATTPILMHADEFFMCMPSDYEKYKEQFLARCQEGKVAVIINKSFVKEPLSSNESQNIVVGGEDEDAIESQKKYAEMIGFFEELDPSSEMEKVSEYSLFGRPMEVYIINP